MSMTDEEWKEAQALAARCVDDPWALTAIPLYGGGHPYALHDKHAFGVVEVYTDDRRLALPGHMDDGLDDARDIEAMRRLFPKLVGQRLVLQKLQAVYVAARTLHFGEGRGRAELEAALEDAIDYIEPRAKPVGS